MNPDEPERPPEHSPGGDPAPEPPPIPEAPAQPPAELVDFGTLEDPAAAEIYEEPYEEPAPQTYAPRQSALYEQPASEPYIPMPGEYAPRGDFHARDAQRNLDLDLGRIKRRKRYGFFLTTLSVIFVAFFIAPVTWVGIYLFIDAPATLLMLQRAAEGETIRHQPVAMTRISPYMVRAVIASEDANFCTHHGFDVEAIQDAMESNAGGGRVRVLDRNSFSLCVHRRAPNCAGVTILCPLSAGFRQDDTIVHERSLPCIVSHCCLHSPARRPWPRTRRRFRIRKVTAAGRTSRAW